MSHSGRIRDIQEVFKSRTALLFTTDSCLYIQRTGRTIYARTEQFFHSEFPVRTTVMKSLAQLTKVPQSQLAKVPQSQLAKVTETQLAKVPKRLS